MKYANQKTPFGNRYYRSRIEAQWAAFLAALPVTFHYEPRSFDIGDCRYTPDFFLPDLGAFLEIKAGNYSDFHLRKIRRLCAITKQRVFLFGEANFASKNGDKCAYGAICTEGVIQEDCLFAWGICPICGAADIGLIYENFLPVCGCNAFLSHDDARLKIAYERASCLA